MLPEKKRGLIWACIFSLKIRVFSKKKDLHFHLLSVFPIFVPKLACSLKKKKKRSSLRIDLLFPYFSHKIMVFSKKKGLHSESNCDLSIFVTNFRCPLKMPISFATHSLKNPGSKNSAQLAQTDV